MNITLKKIVGAGLLVGLLTATASMQAAEDLEAKAKEAIANFKQADAGLTKLFEKSAGYLVLPGVGEGGFIIGGQHGDGLLYENQKVTGKVSMTEVSVGAQAGGAKFAEVIFFETKEDLTAFKNTKCELSAGAKASIAASGAAENAKYEEGVSVFTLPLGGAMVAAKVGGQKFKFEPLKK
jgi:lipid-binding SYLF domain-containing protein